MSSAVELRISRYMDAIYAVNKDGSPILESILKPLFSSLRPALLDKAEQIEVRANLTSQSCEMFYCKGQARRSLIPDPEFHPFITSSRIKILAGISLSAASKQAGVIRIFFVNDILEVAVDIETDNELEIVRLKPKWRSRNQA
jgi:hypothetical protein